MDEPLFDSDAYVPIREDQACEDCLIRKWASDDELRVLGWLVFDGISETREPLHVRICPRCQRRAEKQEESHGEGQPYRMERLPGMPDL